MNYLYIYENIMRIILLFLAIYYIYKHNFKLIIPIGFVFILTFLPTIIDKLFYIKIDLLGSILYFNIIFMTIYLGSALKFYDKFFWWDLLIHFLSGITFVSFGIAISGKINGLNNINILFFSFTFSISLHVLWEVSEYLIDCIKHTNAQRWQRKHDSINHKSIKAIQPAGLVDTMNDTIICLLGTLLSCVTWWFVM